MNEVEQLVNAATNLGAAKGNAAIHSADKAAAKIFTAESDASHRAFADECDKTLKMKEADKETTKQIVDAADKTLQAGDAAIQKVQAMFPDLKFPKLSTEEINKCKADANAVGHLDEAAKQRIQESIIHDYENLRAKYLLENGIDNRFDHLSPEERYKNLILQNMAEDPPEHFESEEEALALAMQNYLKLKMQQFDDVIAKERALRDAQIRLQDAAEKFREKHNKRNNFWSAVFTIGKIAVLGAVAWFAPPLLGAALPTLVGAVGTASSAIATGCAVATADAAVQEIGVATNLQDHFSLNEVLESGVSVGAGNLSAGMELMNHAATVATANAATQLVEVETGLREKFDLQGVGLQTASLMVAEGIKEVMPLLTNVFGDNDATKMVAKATDTAVNAALEHKIKNVPLNPANLAMQVVGEIAGEKLGEALAAKMSTTDVKVAKKAIDENDIAKTANEDLPVSKMKEQQTGAATTDTSTNSITNDITNVIPNSTTNSIDKMCTINDGVYVEERKITPIEQSSATNALTRMISSGKISAAVKLMTNNKNEKYMPIDSSGSAQAQQIQNTLSKEGNIDNNLASQINNATNAVNAANQVGGQKREHVPEDFEDADIHFAKSATAVLQKLAEAEKCTPLNPRIFDQTQKTLEILADFTNEFAKNNFILQSSIQFIAEARKHLRSFIYGTPEEHQQAVHDLAVDAVMMYGAPKIAAKGIKVLSTALDFTLFAKKASPKLVTNAMSDSIELYRAVRPAELEQILNTNSFELIPGMAEEKYFSTSLENIKQYAEMAESAFGDPPYVYVKTSIPKSIADKFLGPNVDRGIETVMIPKNYLKNLKPEIIEKPELGNKRVYG